MDELNNSLESTCELNEHISGNESFILLAGDIVAVNPGTESGIPSADKPLI